MLLEIRLPAANGTTGAKQAGGLAAPKLAAATLFVLAIATLLLVYGAWKAYPIFDDGWLDLMLREQGPEAVERGLADRPVYGWLLKWASRIPGSHALVFSLINAALWLAFAGLTARLWRMFYPGLAQFGSTAALLVLAPIAVQAQMCTMSVNISSLLSALLGYAALAVLYRHAQAGSNAYTLPALGALMHFSGIMVSEYAIPVAIQGLLLLAALAIQVPATRRRAMTSAAVFFAVTPAGYALYRSVADPAARPSVAPGIYAVFPDTVFNLFTGTWKILLGSYGAALAQIRMSWDSKSELLGLALGALVALALAWQARRGNSEQVDDSGASSAGAPHPALLAIAVLLGMAPIALMGRNTTLSDTGTRFQIAVQAVAVIFTLRLLLGFARRRWQPALAAVLGFVSVCALTSAVFQAIQFQNKMRIAGEQMKPLVAAQPELTLAIVPAEVQPNTLIGKSVQGWDPALTRRLWMTNAPGGAVILGPRHACLADPSIVHDERGLRRNGPVRQALWVELAGPTPVVEPYCRPGVNR